MNESENCNIQNITHFAFNLWNSCSSIHKESVFHQLWVIDFYLISTYKTREWMSKMNTKDGVQSSKEDKEWPILIDCWIID